MAPSVSTPRFVMPITGRSPRGAIGASAASAMPHTAPAALARIRRVKGFSPSRSPTLGTMAMSLMPMKGAVSPDATVETSTLGRP